MDEICGKVLAILPTKTFLYKSGGRKGQAGKLQTLIIESEDQKLNGCPWYKYKVLIWSRQMKQFSYISPGKQYRLSHFKQVAPSYPNKEKGFYTMEIHLVQNSKVELYNPEFDD